MTILPGHRAKIEKIIDEGVETTFEGLPVHLIDTNPSTCTEAILQVLALSFNVDISGLQPCEARKAVLSAFMVNRRRGTVYAVKEAVRAVWEDADIIEFSDKPYMFAATLKLAEGDTLEPVQYEKIKAQAERAKNIRSHFNLMVKTQEMKALIAVGRAAALRI